MTHYPPLARLREDQPPERTATAAELAAERARFELARQPEGFVPDLPVTGRSQPRPEPLPVDFRHDVRFHGAAGGLGVSVYCQPCHWGCWIDDGHTLPDLIRLVAQHAGIPDTTATTTEALMALLKPLVTL